MPRELKNFLIITDRSYLPDDKKNLYECPICGTTLDVHSQTESLLEMSCKPCALAIFTGIEE